MAEAEGAGAHYYHWRTPESVRLCQCYSNVSNEEGGPGSSQRLEFLWEKICNRYHSTNPPVVTDRNGNPGPPRTKQQMITKWRKMSGFLSAYLKALCMARASHKSGESAQQDIERAEELYFVSKKAKFTLQLEFAVLEVNQKWMLDNAGAEEQAACRAGIAQQTPMKARLELVDDANPTCDNTAKPFGVKKARSLKAGLAAQEAEEAALEARMKHWAEHFGQRAAIGHASNEVASERNEIFQAAQDDFMLLRDTSRMPPEVLRVFQMAQRAAMKRIVDRCERIQVIAHEAANAARAAESARVAAQAAADLAAQASEEEEEVEDETEEEEEEVVAETGVTEGTAVLEESVDTEGGAEEGADGGDNDSDTIMFDTGDWRTDM